MNQAPVSLLNKASASEEIYEQTGERLFVTGEYVAPAEYVETETNRRIALAAPGFLPARLDGHVACYRLVRRGLEETRDVAFARRQEMFQRFTAQTHQRLYGFVRRATGNAQDAEDVTQETLARAWNHFDAFDPQRSFEAWVFRIASNLMIDQSRRKRHRREVSLDAPATYPHEDAGENEILCSRELADRTGSPLDRLLASEISADLLDALHSLPPTHRATLLLIAQQRSYEQIASTCNCPVGTVRSRVYRARIMMRRTLKARIPSE